jgi:uracil-DNA glycosylase family 4
VTGARSDGPAERLPVAPGSGWPGDPATAKTPVAHDAADVARLARSAPSPSHLDARVSVCRACPRLVAWREDVARERRAAYADQRYWGRPVPSFGPSGGGRAAIIVVGLAPAAHGANRTGRMFTGDRSGDWLYAALHRAGIASQASAISAGDGLRLDAARIVAPVHCAPPANKPLPEERDACAPWLHRDLELARPGARVFLALGGYGWASLWPALRAAGYDGVPARPPAFRHGREVALGESGRAVVGCYHPSQQNTFTGRLTEPMLDAVVVRAVTLSRPDGVAPRG